MNDIITINPKAIILLQQGKDITLTLEAKSELEKLLQVKELIDSAFEIVQERLSQEFESRKIKKVVAGEIVISKRLYGSRYKITGDVSPEFTKETTYTKPNSEIIEKYYEEKGELPTGISLKERAEIVSIVKREDE